MPNYRLTLPGAIIDETLNKMNDAFGGMTDEDIINQLNTIAQNKAALEELEEEVFPVTSKLTPGKSLLEYTGQSQNVVLSWTISKKGATVTPELLSITKDGTSIGTLDLVGSGSTTTGVLKLGSTAFALSAVFGGKQYTASCSVNSVLPMYFGFSTAETVSDLGIYGLTKQTTKTGPAGEYTLAHTGTAKFLWLCVPSSMSISGVTSSGFSVPFEAYVSKGETLGTYRCYRSTNRVVEGSMTFKIT